MPKKAETKKPKMAKPKAPARIATQSVAGGEKPIGEITHYFSNIGVAVIKLAGPLKEGEEIRIVGGEETDFNQAIDSMQIEHEKVKSAKKGDSVGLKVKEKVREGYKVYRA